MPPEPMPPESMSPTAPPPPPPALEARGLTATAPSGRVLVAVDALDLAPGARLGLRGASGAGKSTLLMALAGLAPGAAGRVAWDGADLCAMGPGARAAFRRRRLGFVFQDFHLFDELSAEANAAVAALFAPRAARPALRARARAALADLALPDPGQPAATLSGGERQRVAVARALAGDPGILLADEPTANLQRPAADALAAALAGLGGARTVVVASHDEALLARMDRVITLRDGRVADG